jgi:hypothetical protein
MGDGAELASGYDAADYQRVALSSAPKGLSPQPEFVR